MKYKIRYTPHGIFTNVSDVDCGNHIYICASFSRCLKSISYTYQYQNNKMVKKIDQLTLTYFNLFVNHSNIFDKVNLNLSTIHPFACDNVLDAFIYAYISYIVLISLLTDTDFIDILPFQFEIPCTLTDGDAASYHTLNYFLLPLTITNKLLEEKWIKDYFKVLIYFITNYASLFPAGPWLDNQQLTIDTLSGLTDFLVHERSSKCAKADNSFMYQEKTSSEVFDASSTTFFSETSPNRISDLSLLYNKNTEPSSSSTTNSYFSDTSKNIIDKHDLLYNDKKIETKSTSDLSELSFKVVNTFNKNVKNELLWRK